MERESRSGKHLEERVQDGGKKDGPLSLQRGYEKHPAVARIEGRIELEKDRK